MREVLVSKVARIGKRTVSRDGDRYFVGISNRTYRSEYEVSKEVALRHLEAIKKE